MLRTSLSVPNIWSLAYAAKATFETPRYAKLFAIITFVKCLYELIL